MYSPLFFSIICMYWQEDLDCGLIIFPYFPFFCQFFKKNVTESMFQRRNYIGLSQGCFLNCPVYVIYFLYLEIYRAHNIDNYDFLAAFWFKTSVFPCFIPLSNAFSWCAIAEAGVLSSLRYPRTNIDTRKKYSLRL